MPVQLLMGLALIWNYILILSEIDSWADLRLGLSVIFRCRSELYILLADINHIGYSILSRTEILKISHFEEV